MCFSRKLLPVFFFFLIIFPILADEPDDVVLYGATSVTIREDSSISDGTIVSGGNLFLARGADIVGDVYVTTRLLMQSGSTITGDVNVGDVATLRGTATITGTLTESSTDIPEATIPEYTVSRGTTSVVVTAGTSQTLAEGDYNYLVVESGSTLTLSGGTYHVGRFILQENSNLIVDAPTVLTSIGSFRLDPASVTFSGSASVAGDLILYTPNPNISAISDGSVFTGVVYVPNGRLVIGIGASVRGTFKADSIAAQSTSVIEWGTEEPSCISEVEICDDGIDQDCDGLDLSCADADLDGDGYSTNEGDSDDTDASVNPAATEVCDGIDNDGDGFTDDDDSSLDLSTRSVFYVDADGDGYGDSSAFVLSCDRAFGYVTDSTDCDDTNISIYPGATELCDAIDNNCDGNVDGNDEVSDCDAGVTLPVDPEEIASTLSETSTTSISESTEFLYTGDNPTQSGVAESTIDATHAAVIRGTVLDNTSTALPGVTVSILNHSEYGTTLTRDDGSFDMVINGGGLFTVTFEKEGYFTAQRGVDAPWQDYAVLDDLILLSQSSAVTEVTLSSITDMTSAIGESITDDDGTRTPTLLLSSGTTANLETSDGTTVSVDTLNLRATEYTSGETGPSAMPGTLPATSAYTYAVELTADEAISADGVEFSNPLYYYLENFLDMPSGTAVPAGYYDEELAAWVASDNGIVLKIINISGGVAEISISEDDSVASSADLTDLNVTTSELEQLGSRYSIGQSLWRIPISHFSPWDFNWPFMLPEDAEAPALAGLFPLLDSDLEDPCIQCGGSALEIENQVLRESLPITGSNFSLNYTSARVPGRAVSNSISFPVTDSSIPASLERVEVTIDVAGQHTSDSLAAAADQTYSYTWDGLDGYGRTVQGSQIAHVRIGYVYSADYAATREDSVNSFAAFGDPDNIAVEGSREEITLWSEQDFTVGNISSINTGIAGFTIDPHHFYDPHSKILYMGTGEQRSVQEIPEAITTIVGTGTCGSSGDGGDATDAALCQPYDVAIDSDGNIYISDYFNNRVRKIDTDGIISTVAGTGSSGAPTFGGAATASKIYHPQGIDVDTNGNLYIVIGSPYYYIVKVDSDGILTNVAGTGTAGFSGDGGVATSAQISSAFDVAVGADGSLYFTDTGNKRIRKIDAAGNISTVAGNGSSPSGTTVSSYHDGDAALDAPLGSTIRGIDVDLQGNIYFVYQATKGHVRKIAPDGTMTKIAGIYNAESDSGDGSSATDVQLVTPEWLVVDSAGNVYVSELYRVRKIGTDGIATTFAGTGASTGEETDGTLATAANFSNTKGITLNPNDEMYAVMNADRSVRKIAKPLPSYTGSDHLIPSKDGTLLYHFDSDGKHLETTYLPTNQVITTFAYNTDGYLTSITDGDGNVTTINRDSSNNPTSIATPFGPTTTITTNADGYLSTLTNPDGETFTLTYHDGGLLATFTNPRSNTSSFTYDSLGRLTLDTNALSGYFQLTRTDETSAYEVNELTAMGRSKDYRVETQDDGGLTRTTTDEHGLVTTTQIEFDGQKSITTPDGTEIISIDGPDERFGMLSPVSSTYQVMTPDGLTYDASSTRSITLSDADDLTSLTAQTDTSTINGRIYTNAYNAATRQITSTSPEARTSVTTIDTQGRPTNIHVTDITDVAYAYDANGRLDLITQGARSTDFDYDANGYLDVITDSLSRTVTFDYDNAGRVTTQTLPDSRQIVYTYDDNGNLESITPPGRPTHYFDYDELNQMSDYLPPDIGLGGTNTQYAYNLDKEIDLITRPDGTTIDFAYDSGGWLDTVTIPRGVFTYSYDLTTGNLDTIENPEGDTISYDYDGFLVTSTTWAGTIVGNVTYTYDDNFWLESLSLRGAEGDVAIQIDFDYDDDGLLTNAGDLILTRDPDNGLITNTTLSTVTTTMGYNAYGEFESDDAQYSGTSNYSVTLTRDTIGRIETKTETVEGTAHTTTYTYDTTGRLDTVTIDGVLSNDYNYDDNGNRDTGTYDDQDRLLTYGSNTYTYTDNGELLTKSDGSGTTTYTYDALGNLTNVSFPSSDTIEYIVDGENRRIGKKYNGILTQGFLYQDQLRVVAELNSDGSVKSRFIYGSKSNVPDYMIKEGTTYRIISDHLGSVRLVIDTADGSIDQRIDYDEFGNVTYDSSPGFQPFGFAGGLYDSDTGLTKFGARDYDAETGRWTNKDPILFDGGDTNLYGYVLNDPVNWVDPSGLSSDGTNEPVAEVCLRMYLGNYWACSPFYEGDWFYDLTEMDVYEITNSPCIGFVCVYPIEQWQNMTSCDSET